MQDVGCRCTLNGVTFTYWYTTYVARVLLTELPSLTCSKGIRFHHLRLCLKLRFTRFVQRRRLGPKASSLQFQTCLVAKSSNQFRLPSVGVPNVQVYS